MTGPGRDPGIAILDGKVVREAQRPKRGRMFVLSGRALFGVSLILGLLASRGDPIDVHSRFPYIELESEFWVYAGSGLAFIAALLLVRRGRRHLAPVYMDVMAEAVARDAGPPVLYLRPFVEDGAAYGVPTRNPIDGLERFFRLRFSYEEELEQIVRSVGPLVVIGRPDERLPELGGLREYATPDDWKPRVEQLSTHAGTTILQIGVSHSLTWEIETAIRVAGFGRLILAVGQRKGRWWQPGSPIWKEWDRRRFYERFRHHCGDRLLRDLPDKLGTHQFISFEADGRAILPPSGRPKQRLSSTSSTHDLAHHLDYWLRLLTPWEWFVKAALSVLFFLFLAALALGMD